MEVRPLEKVSARASCRRFPNGCTKQSAAYCSTIPALMEVYCLPWQVWKMNTRSGFIFVFISNILPHHCRASSADEDALSSTKQLTVNSSKHYSKYDVPSYPLIDIFRRRMKGKTVSRHNVVLMKRIFSFLIPTIWASAVPRFDMLSSWLKKLNISNYIYLYFFNIIIS